MVSSSSGSSAAVVVEISTCSCTVDAIATSAVVLGSTGLVDAIVTSTVVSGTGSVVVTAALSAGPVDATVVASAVVPSTCISAAVELTLVLGASVSEVGVQGSMFGGLDSLFALGSESM
jgi:hypothetical protein